jgi:hypothetical protein
VYIKALNKDIVVDINWDIFYEAIRISDGSAGLCVAVLADGDGGRVDFGRGKAVWPSLKF